MSTIETFYVTNVIQPTNVGGCCPIDTYFVVSVPFSGIPTGGSSPGTLGGKGLHAIAQTLRLATDTTAIDSVKAARVDVISLGNNLYTAQLKYATSIERYDIVDGETYKTIIPIPQVIAQAGAFATSLTAALEPGQDLQLSCLAAYNTAEEPDTLSLLTFGTATTFVPQCFAQ
jgi:hypothetical protein